MMCIDLCKCKLLRSSVFFFFLLSLLSFKVTCKSGGAGFHDLKLYECIYQIKYVTIYNKIMYLLLTTTHLQVI